jgi:type IV pilus assembly protein PilN
MIRINLLPREVRAEKVPAAMLLPAGIVLTAVIAIMIPVTISMRTSCSSLHRQMVNLQREIDRFQPQVQRVDEMEKNKTQLQARKNLVLLLENERLTYPVFFEDLLKELPSNLWFTSMTTVKKPDSSMGIDLDIVALDNYVIADFLSNLETSKTFTGADLGTISAAQNPAGGTTLSFHLRMNYRAQVATNAINTTQRP